MASDRIDHLSPRERECLRFVRRGFSSKQIAKELGISHHTVDDHLKRAIATLGVATRFDASRILADHELSPQPLGAKPPAIATAGPSRSQDASDRSDRAPWWSPLPLRRNKERTNDLTAFQTLTWILILSASMLFGLSQLANMMSIVLSIARGRGN